MTYPAWSANLTEKERLAALTKSHLHNCGGMLTAAWDRAFNSYTLRCGKCDHFVGEDELVRRRSLTRQYKDGDTLPLVITNRIEAKEDRKLEKEIGVDKARSLAPLRQILALTRDQARDIVVTLWPDAPLVEVTKASMLCAQYHWNPLLKHVALVKYWNKKRNAYDWVTMISMEATRLNARRRHVYSFTDGTPRVMTEAEQKATFGEVDTDNIVTIVKLKDVKTGAEAPGIGRFSRTGDEPKGSEKGNTRFNQSCIRAERQATKRLYPDEMPGDVEVMDAEYMPEPTISEVPKIEERTGSINPETGEIEEGDYRDPDDFLDELKETKDPLTAWSGTSRPQQAAPEPQKTASEPESHPIVQPEAGKATVSTAPSTESAKSEWPHLDTFGQLMTRANQDYNIKIADVCTDLGVSAIAKVMITPDEAWAIIVQKRGLKSKKEVK